VFELWKIGVVYRDQHPQMFVDLAPEGMPWRFEFIHEDALLSAAANPRCDFLAVFFSPDDALPDVRRQLSGLFPGAEIIGYQNRAKGCPGTLHKREDGVPLIQLPMSFALAQRLLESIALLKSHQTELALVRRRADSVQEFFDALVNTVESSWSINDRKLGMSLFINRVLNHLHAEECLLYLFNNGGIALQRAYSTGNIKDIDLFDYHANSSIVENVLSTGTPYINNNYSFEIKVPFSKESVFIRSILCYPLQRRGEKLGVIEVLNKIDGAFTEEDQVFVQTLSSPLTVAIRTVQMFENAEHLTITDDLTKLYNYRYLMQYLEAEVKRCLRYKKKVSLLFIDIDGFKRINDSFGHLVGSQALAEMGQVFRRILRETDVVGRYGGDEFVIVLPETPLNGAMVIAERIRKKVEDYEFIAQNLSIRLTVSLGVANCPKHTLTAEGLIKKADAAMYRAKELSKNSIKVAVSVP
jgi:diguanylate cyclase (GGDEF)-like protein